MIELLNTRMYEYRKGIVSGLAKFMDIIILNDVGKINIIYNKPLNKTRTIFINTRCKQKLILYFIDHILPQLKSPINLVIAGEDWTFPNSIDKRFKNDKIFLERKNELKNLGKHKYIHRVFVENLDENLENMEPIPLGVNSIEYSVYLDHFLKYEKIDPNKPLYFTNFNRVRDDNQHNERRYVLNLSKTEWGEFYIPTGTCNHDTFMNRMSQYLFTICVHGGGLDVNPKLFEALLVGVIPIIKENRPYTDIYKKLDFPVVIIKSWDKNTINKDKLELWKKKYYHYFTDKIKRDEMLKKMCLHYWVKYIKNIT